MPTKITAAPQPAILELPERFYDPVRAATFPQAILRFRNTTKDHTIGLDTLSDDAWVEHFGRFTALPDNLPEPLALRYHGHQFRHYNPDLGDGRGFLFAQFREAGTGRLLDLGTKGTGPTPYSRRGDGRLTLKGGVRELLATEMLEARGVNTSKTFSLVETGEALHRGDEPSPTRSCVLVRLSHAHVRFGTFQRLAALDDKDGIITLLHYCVRHYYPHLAENSGSDGQLAEAFVHAILHEKAKTVGGWMAAGFVHGVLNTDNMNITGESFDYGPWRFLPYADPGLTAAYFDHQGLYAYGQQPSAVLWNLSRLAECFLHLSTTERMTSILMEFNPQVTRAWELHFLRLLGVRATIPAEDTRTLFAAMHFLEESRAPYDQFLFDWFGGASSTARAMQGPNAAHYQGPAFDEWLDAFRQHPALPTASTDTPYYRAGVPASLHIDEVERIWAPIAEHDDWHLVHETVDRIRASAIAP